MLQNTRNSCLQFSRLLTNKLTYSAPLRAQSLSEKTSYMLVCTIYILVGMAITTTIIELVRWEESPLKESFTVQFSEGGSTRRAGERCRS